MNQFIFTMMLTAIMLTTFYSIKMIKDTMMVPAMKLKTYIHSSQSNNNISLNIMSIMSVTVGSILQWMMPINYSLKTPMSENIQSVTTYTIMAIMTTMLLLQTLKMKNLTYSINKYKIFTTLMFSVPISTQSLMKFSMNLSMNLYKYIDQTWLEKMSNMSLNMMVYSSYKTNLSMLLSPQKNFLNMFYSSMMIIMTFSYYMYMLM